MKRRYMIFLLAVIMLMVAYWAGPRLVSAELDAHLPVVPAGIDSIEKYVNDREAALPVKPGNEGIILWGDSVGQPTAWVLLYLHGFTASRFEGYPLTHDFAREFRVNAYLPRLAGHGLEVKEPLLDMTPANLYNSAKEALVIAHKLGKKVVIMGSSTGCTLALMLAADFPQLVEGLILYSPNIKIKNPLAPLLSGPWGLQISQMVFRGKYSVSGASPDSAECRYWNCRYRLEAQVYLQQLIDMRMNKEEFQKVHQPVFLGYYYKDRFQQDQTVRVSAALKMFDELGTPDREKRKVAFPEAGVHVIACGWSSGAIEEVRKETFEFARQILKME